MRIIYNAPVVLSFSLIATALMLLGTLTGNAMTEKFFAVYPNIGWKNPIDWFRLVSHVLGHIHVYSVEFVCQCPRWRNTSDLCSNRYLVHWKRDPVRPLP